MTTINKKASLTAVQEQMTKLRQWACDTTVQVSEGKLTIKAMQDEATRRECLLDGLVKNHMVRVGAADRLVRKAVNTIFMLGYLNAGRTKVKVLDNLDRLVVELTGLLAGLTVAIANIDTDTDADAPVKYEDTATTTTNSNTVTTDSALKTGRYVSQDGLTRYWLAGPYVTISMRDSNGLWTGPEVAGMGNFVTLVESGWLVYEDGSVPAELVKHVAHVMESTSTADNAPVTTAITTILIDRLEAHHWTLQGMLVGHHEGYSVYELPTRCESLCAAVVSLLKPLEDEAKNDDELRLQLMVFTTVASRKVSTDSIINTMSDIRAVSDVLAKVIIRLKELAELKVYRYWASSAVFYRTCEATREIDYMTLTYENKWVPSTFMASPKGWDTFQTAVEWGEMVEVEKPIKC